ncbi:DUF938 domain-containing protein [Methylobacterium sp. BTF04]|uniref:DUF938 domain-containing protein n=1 Tax=Methylobacterium sp. BTF04 TaxID=2708300 RepID=UPI0013D0A30B|nr:DUF938 domain-containing protein [Methylobacterium sp. BTF04]NEU14557.1 DUF938 domain-containing protein [Methylobacterium sp. BTF04]
MLGWETDGDALVAPAVARNRDAILAVLQRILPRTGVILEVGSGSGEHAVHFARRLPAVTWQPSDAEPAALRSIVAHARGAGLANILPPVPLDAAAADWPVDHADAVVAINVVHIAPWQATGGLMAGAARVLPAGGCLYLYGAFTQDGRQTSESNADFDADLRARDPAWGLRDIAVVAEAGRTHGLQLAEIVAMPANNLSVVFRRD